jgi:hypothetical protein
MTIIDYNERLTLDTELWRHFASLSAPSFIRFQRELLDVAFLDQTTTEEATGLRERKLHLYRLISECGLNENHFDRMKMHLIESLRHSWVNSDIIEIANNHLDDLRYLFAHQSFVVSPPPKSAADHSSLPPTTRSSIHNLAGISSKTFGQQRRLQK